MEWFVYWPFNGIAMDSWIGCANDLGWICDGTANDQGVAEFRSPWGVYAGTFSPTMYAYGRDGSFLGATSIVLTVTPRATSEGLVLKGSGQRAVIGTQYAAPFVVQVLNAAGRPVHLAKIVFNVSSPHGAASGTFVNPMPSENRMPSESPKQSIAITNEFGLASSATFVAGWGLGRGTVTAEMFDPIANIPVRDTFDFENTNADGSTFTSFQDLWWGGIYENGWGMAVVQHGETLFNAIFAYDADGHPTWYVQPGGAWDEGLGSSFTGPIYSPRGSPYFAYDTSRFDIGPSLDIYSLLFNGPDAGTLRASPAFRPIVDKRIERLDFSSETPPPMEGVGDLWWGGVEQNGWGVAVMEKEGSLFSLWFTYDAAGKPIWFPMEDGGWVDATTYAGKIFRTSSSPWPYDYSPAQLRVTPAGTFAFRFADREHLTFEYSLEGHTGSLALRRLGF